MKKIMLIWVVLFFGLSYQSVAKAGMASDEYEFFLIIIGFILLVAAFIEGIDYLKKNGKTLFLSFWTFLKNKILILRKSH